MMDILLLFIIGLFFGSFLNVLADRLPRGESVIWERSHCERCKHLLAWYDLIPLLSYFLLGGKCRYCRRSFSVQYPLAELAAGGMFAVLYWLLPFSTLAEYVMAVAICCSLFVIVLADLRYHIIPDELLITLCLLTVVSMFIFPYFGIADILPSSLLSRLEAIGVMTVVFGGLVAITHGRGMGLGDVKYAIWMGFFLGLQRSMVAFYLAFLTGALLSLILIVWKKKSLKSAVAFGPFLVFGTVIAWWYGDGIWNWFWLVSTSWV